MVRGKQAGHLQYNETTHADLTLDRNLVSTAKDPTTPKLLQERQQLT